ncbi:hypothetical protein [Aeromicrobium sp. Sec7.5]|uniref:hypothetical protein n=1 Tax=Aeromicrobium sp. Sec7.5 TaxID=3121276 RepID=UPI002FE4B875
MVVAFAVVALQSNGGGGGSSGSDSIVPDDGSQLTELAEGEPIAEPGDFRDSPEGPTDLPSLDLAEELSDAGSSRSDAEAFAVEFLHLIVDTREEMDVDKMVETLVAEDADPATVSYFETSLARNKGSEIRRVWRTNEESWIRTQTIGDPERPDSISVEIAFSLGLDQDDDFRTWVTHRIDLVRDDDAWRVSRVTFRTLDYAPPDDAPISQALDGTGWRQLTLS